jgi:hypothetical protein
MTVTNPIKSPSTVPATHPSTVDEVFEHLIKDIGSIGTILSPTEMGKNMAGAP